MTINYGSLGMSYLDPSQLPAMLTLEESNIPVPYVTLIRSESLPSQSA
jgi:hypothetical protein